MKTSLRMVAFLWGAVATGTCFGAIENVTIHNNSSGSLTVLDLSNASSYTVATGTHTLSLDDLHTYSVAQYNLSGDPGHEFSFSGGQVVPGGNAPLTNEYFNVAGNDVYVNGIQFTARLVTDVVGYSYQDLYALPGMPYGYAKTTAYANPDYLAYLLPSDGNYNGTFSLQFYTPAANPATLVIGMNGVISLTGAGASYVVSGPHSIQATLSNGNILELTAIPEPSSVLLLVLGGILFARRNKAAARD